MAPHNEHVTEPVAVAVASGEKTLDTPPQVPLSNASDSERTVQAENEVSERKVKGLKWLIVVLALLAPTFLYSLDNTILANVRPSIISNFDNRVDMLTWLSVSYPMGELGANPLWGKLNEHFDNKIVFLVAVLIFEVGSVVIGSAQNIDSVVIGRAIGGLGGSGIYVGTISIMSTMTTPVERTQYLNFVGMTWSLGTVLGPVIGGAFADSSATWRWAFYINVCIAAVTVPACVWLVPPIRRPTALSRFARLKRLDFVGFLLFLGAVASIIMVLGFGGAEYDWHSGPMIGLYVATVVLWCLFSLQQGLKLFTVDRIFPVHLATQWETINLFAWTAIAIANIVVTIYSLPLFFQFSLGDSALRAAVFTLPFILSVVASAGAAGPIFSKYPVYMPWFAGAGAIMLIGNGLLTTLDRDTSRGTLCGYTVIQGLGVGPVIQLGYTVGQTKAARSAVPQVTAFLTCAQMAGLALSLGIATSVFLNGAAAEIAAILPETSRSLILVSINGARTDLLQDISDVDRNRILEAVARNVGKVFYMNVAGAAFGLLSSLTMKRDRLTL